MNLSLIISICLVLLSSDSVYSKKDSSSSSSSSEESGNLSSNQARYDNYRVYYVQIETDEHVKLFQDLEAKSDSCIFYGHSRHTGQNLTIMVAAHKVADFADILDTYKIKHKLLTKNFQEKINKQNHEIQPKTIPAKRYDWKHYFHLETIYSWMELHANAHDFLTVLDMGNSHEGVPIKGIKFSKNSSNPTVFIESGIHAREWITPAVATYLLNELLTSSDPRIQKYASDLNWIIFPVVNPDGYKYTFEKDRMWRKNRQLFGICRGVDLNRNYPFHWNETGSSPNPCDYDYSGPKGNSEVETQLLTNFVKSNVDKEKIRSYIALHSYSQLIMFPFGYTKEKVQNYDDLKEIGQKAADEIKRISGRDYTSGSLHETIYPSSGGSKDWAYAVAGIPITFTFELRGPRNSTDLFILSAKEIEGTSEEAVGAIMTIVEEADKKGYYKR